MKSIKLIVLLCLSTILFSNCKKDFLSIYPTNSKTNATFFKTQVDVFQTLVGCYSGMNGWLNGTQNWTYPIVSDIMSDDASGGAGKSDYLLPQAVDRFDPSIAPGEANIYQGIWGSAWSDINRCNLFLKLFNTFPWDDSSAFAKQNYFTKSGSVGEVKFIRAYMYFVSMQMWGHLPLITEETKDPGNEPQADSKLIYEQIVKDLQDAIKVLPSSYPSDANGRITKYAAEALIARVYLFYTGYYGNTIVDLPRVNKTELLTYMGNILNKSDVTGYLTDIIQNSGYGLVANYESLWPAGAAAAGVPYAGESNNEVVFAIKNGYSSGTSMNWVDDMGARGYIMPPYGRGWGFDVGNKSLWDSWDPNDTRKVASLMNVSQEKNPFNGDSYSDADAGLDVREYQGLFLKKYLRQTDANGNEIFGAFVGNPSSMSSFTDYIVIRYADVLLMAAELGIDAQANFDKVRQRAYGNAVPPPEDATFENIMDERHHEFVGEAIRYWDLLRRGVEYAANAIQIAAPGVPVRNGAYIYGTTNIVIKGDRIMATYGLSQIPEEQITLSNGNLVQNEGW